MSDRPLYADEIRSMSMEERLRLLTQLRIELAKLREQARVGTLRDVSRIKIIRKNIARILTVINEEKKKTQKEKKR